MQHEFQQILDTNPILLFSVDTDGCFRMLAGQFASSLRLPKDEIIGRAFTEIYPERTELSENFARVMQGEHLVTDITLDSGDILEFHLNPLLDHEQNIIGCHGMAYDVTRDRLNQFELEKRDKILSATGYAMANFSRSSAWQDVIHDVLAQIGEATNVSRVYICQRDTAGHYEWPSNPNESFLDLRLPELTSWRLKVQAGEHIVGTKDEFTSRECDLLAQHHIQSLAIIPIPLGETCWGYIAFEQHDHPRKWSASEIDTLQTIAGMLQSVVQRQQAVSQEHEERTFSDSLTGITAMISTLELNEVLDQILQNVHVAAPHNAANVILIRNGVGHIVRHRGYEDFVSSEALTALELCITDYPTFQNCVQTLSPIIVNDTQNDERWVETTEMRWIRSYLGAPIVLNNTVIGLIGLDSSTENFFTLRHIRRLEAFANIAAIAIQNATNFQESVELAAIRERQRISRDLHDAVTQTVYSATFMTQALPNAVDNNPHLAKELIQRLQRHINGAHAELRTMLHELRPDSLIEADLKTLLTQLGHGMASRSDTICYVDIDNQIPMQLPSNVKIMLYRIAQEALNNVTKHAKAQSVTLSLRPEQDLIVLEIADDGRGFDDLNIPSNCFGLRHMVERAQDIGAKIDIATQLGAGTRITVIWEGNKSHES